MSKFCLIGLLLTVLTACGGGGGGEIDPEPPKEPLNITGKVMAGSFLVGSTVFADCNSNYVLDLGEESTSTIANGVFILPGDAGIEACPLIAEVTTSTLDQDTGLNSTRNYLMSSPEGTFVISPLSTLLRETMLSTGNNITKAGTDIKADLGLDSGVNLLADYITPGGAANITAYEVAKVIAALYGDFSPVVMNAIIDADYPSGSYLVPLIQTIIQSRVTDLLADVNTAVNTGGGISDLDAVVSELVTASDTSEPFASNIINEVLEAQQTRNITTGIPFTESVVSGKTFYYTYMGGDIDKITFNADGSFDLLYTDEGVPQTPNSYNWSINTVGNIIVNRDALKFTTFLLFADGPKSMWAEVYDSSQAGPIPGEDDLVYVKTTPIVSTEIEGKIFVGRNSDQGVVVPEISFVADGTGTIQPTPLSDSGEMTWFINGEGNIVITIKASGATLTIPKLATSEIGAINGVMETRSGAGVLMEMQMLYFSAL